ncbi:hypothetical protein, partial [Rhizobium leguminosarum]|uniref:hypothetical protein n=1 Tax=Rhizobium leguminosarum TaxID=384 RepID=UPI003F9E1FCE
MHAVQREQITLIALMTGTSETQRDSRQSPCGQGEARVHMIQLVVLIPDQMRHNNEIRMGALPEACVVRD